MLYLLRRYNTVAPTAGLFLPGWLSDNSTGKAKKVHQLSQRGLPSAREYHWWMRKGGPRDQIGCARHIVYKYSQ